jgi:hypothetical protein
MTHHPIVAPGRVPRWAFVTAAALTASWIVFFAIVAFTDSDAYWRMLRKDGPDGAGLVENLTVLVLIPAILVAAYTLIRRWREFPSRLVALWLLAWAAACVYFAGEEISWGQWYFGWTAPDWITPLNDQDETNLHNISSWLDQKPRALVETFIVVAGLVAPIVLRAAPSLRRRLPRADLLQWVFAPSLCWLAAAYFLLIRVSGGLPGTFFRLHNSSELRELAVAWFLALYLTAYALRLPGRTPPACPRTTTGGG